MLRFSIFCYIPKQRAKKGSRKNVLYYGEIQENIGIKSISWDYSWHEEYLEELNVGKILEYSLLLAVLPQNKLDPNIVEKWRSIISHDVTHSQHSPPKNCYSRKLISCREFRLFFTFSIVAFLNLFIFKITQAYVYISSNIIHDKMTSE